MSTPQLSTPVPNPVLHQSPQPPLPRQDRPVPSHSIKIQVRDLTCFYGSTAAVKNISLTIPEHRVTALIGPSGCGKSTFLRSLNRMNEVVRNARSEGAIELNGVDVRSIELTQLRRRVGMVFQKANPFPKSIFDNVAYGLRLEGWRGQRLADAVEQSLQRAALWSEVKDSLHKSAFELSGGQQQRLSIARALALSPEVLLLDEPCSALDPITTSRIEELLHELKTTCTIAIVTHNMQQAARTSDFTGFFLMGKLIELNETRVIFANPRHKETEDYITGRFG
ncbi:MAG TPA: phosphate ABC transporter ATP-binding protein PstB [Terriglobia bacterium]|nr:phosphate ABC transporter ATP-binding protein PstB [Terriglobia bacterium]